ncbi:putative non-LTR retroelement reverse transcriptase [Trifolium medium]|uniref:Putative non-LTR retroelement reverse transcriptase n=1 Tax=Trifolium medium TaxID=97028 RepID=A0A392QES6_9FABA|nr:putative non-LTR retroelement reverse transcriptase [Trifolium medium]
MMCQCGVKGGKKISWVKWRVVCQEKKNGGLGVRDLKAVNLSLLMKWRWRLLQREDMAHWKEVFVAKLRGGEELGGGGVGSKTWKWSAY